MVYEYNIKIIHFIYNRKERKAKTQPCLPAGLGVPIVIGIRVIMIKWRKAASAHRCV